MTKTVGREPKYLVGLAPALIHEEEEEPAGHLVGPQRELWDRKKIFHLTRVPKIGFFK